MRKYVLAPLALALLAWSAPAAHADNGTPAADPPPQVTLVQEFSDTIGAYYDGGMFCSPVAQFRDELVADGIPADALDSVTRVCEPAPHS